MSTFYWVQRYEKIIFRHLQYYVGLKDTVSVISKKYDFCMALSLLMEFLLPPKEKKQAKHLNKLDWRRTMSQTGFYNIESHNRLRRPLRPFQPGRIPATVTPGFH